MTRLIRILIIVALSIAIAVGSTYLYGKYDKPGPGITPEMEEALERIKGQPSEPVEGEEKMFDFGKTGYK